MLSTIISRSDVNKAADMSARDRTAEISMAVMITRKEGVPLDLLYDYWLNIHGVLAARATGAAGYWQHRLGPARTDLFPKISGVNQGAPLGDPVVGLAEITFATLEDRGLLISSASVAEMVIDEQNALKGTYLYATGPSNAFTVLDRLPTNAPLGASKGYRVMIFLRQSPTTSTADFRAFIRADLAAALTASQGVEKVRVHLLEPYDEHAWPTPNVDHKRSKDQLFQALIELAFEDQEAADRLQASSEVGSVAEALADHVAAITAYPVPETYTLVYGGRPTLAGLRGLSAVRILEAIGDPPNEQALPLLRILFGKDVVAPAQ